MCDNLVCGSISREISPVCGQTCVRLAHARRAYEQPTSLALINWNTPGDGRNETPRVHRCWRRPQLGVDSRLRWVGRSSRSLARQLVGSNGRARWWARIGRQDRACRRRACRAHLSPWAPTHAPTVSRFSPRKHTSFAGISP